MADEIDPCECRWVRAGSSEATARNWSRDCPEHGMDSEWWNSPEQIAERQRCRAESVALQAKARLARHAAAAKPGLR